ncbi:MAG: hypothetical protein IPH03_19195 [Tetrasphaera sp.]|nr:hypothetical protein [Tetrasphaera sp.]
MPARIRRTAGGAFAAVLASAYLLITATIGYAAPIVGAVTADATPTPSSTSSAGRVGTRRPAGHPGDPGSGAGARRRRGDHLRDGPRATQDVSAGARGNAGTAVMAAQ